MQLPPLPEEFEKRWREGKVQPLPEFPPEPENKSEPEEPKQEEINKKEIRKIRESVLALIQEIRKIRDGQNSKIKNLEQLHLRNKKRTEDNKKELENLDTYVEGLSADLGTLEYKFNSKKEPEEQEPEEVEEEPQEINDPEDLSKKQLRKEPEKEISRKTKREIFNEYMDEQDLNWSSYNQIEIDTGLDKREISKFAISEEKKEKVETKIENRMKFVRNKQ